MEKIISHFFISLIPYTFLTSTSSDQNKNKESLKDMFNAFYTLVQQDYLKKSGIDLGDFFDVHNIHMQKKWEKIINSITSDLNVSSFLEGIEVASIKTNITKMPDFFSILLCTINSTLVIHDFYVII